MQVLQTVFDYLVYVALVVVAVLVADLIIDWIRAKFGRLTGPGWMAFDAFCDQLRRIVGDGPLASLTRDAVKTLAGEFWDMTQTITGPIWSRETFVEKVLEWYDKQLQIEAAMKSAYTRTVPDETRAKISSLR